jgi:phage terminase small subunit
MTFKKSIKKPKTKEDVAEVDFKKLADQHGLTEMQTKFCYYYVFVTGLNGPLSVELAGYSQGQKYSEDLYPDEKQREFYKGLVLRQQARNLLDNPKVLTLITELRKNLSTQIIVDQLYVLQHLKKIVEGDEPANAKLKALELLGKTMEMFGDKQIIEELEDPAKIAAARFEKRKQAANVVEFTKEG